MVTRYKRNFFLQKNSSANFLELHHPFAEKGHPFPVNENGFHEGLMENVISIHRTRRVFNLSEARSLLPVVLKITAESQREVSRLLNRLEAIKYGSTEAARQMEEQVQSLVDHWQKKMVSLGAHPKGLWLADFDNGTGYYCWKYPESDIGFWHGYQDGFSGRKELFPEGLE